MYRFFYYRRSRDVHFKLFSETLKAHVVKLKQLLATYNIYAE